MILLEAKQTSWNSSFLNSGFGGGCRNSAAKLNDFGEEFKDNLYSQIKVLIEIEVNKIKSKKALVSGFSWNLRMRYFWIPEI